VTNNGKVKNYTMKKEKIKVKGSRRRRSKQLLDTKRKPAVSAFKRPPTYALDCRVTGIEPTLHGAPQF
jgi:hypothetical protein